MRGFHDRLTLIAHGAPEVDEWGNRNRPEIRRDVICAVKSVTRAEFYQASSAGLKPAFTAYVHPFEYNGETLAELRGLRLNISRTFELEVDGVALLELQLTERLGDL